MSNIWHCEWIDADKMFVVHSTRRPHTPGHADWDIAMHAPTFEQAVEWMAATPIVPSVYEWRCLAMRNNNRGRVKQRIERLRQIRKDWGC